MSELQLPELEAVKAYYPLWFESEYGIRPQANSHAASLFALAAMRHFLGARPGKEVE